MKKSLFVTLSVLFLWQGASFAQRVCGFELTRAALIARDPSWAGRLEAQRASLQSIADNYKATAGKGAKKTTSAPVLPVIFHFCVTAGQLAQIGGAAGVAQRCDSQIAVLNRDYNRGNSDSVLIPAGWKQRYANVGIMFGLAHTNPSGFGTPGYEIEIVPDAPGGFAGVGSDYSTVKHNSSGGLDAWDVTEYINIWCLNFTDFPGLLGITAFKSGTGGSGIPADEEGICVNYAAVGRRASSADYYIATGYGSDYYDKGRTTTHEMGHFFEIWHTWGDDGGLCPWNGGNDDGLADTPPEGNAKFYNYRDTIPGGTYFDQCQWDATTDTQLILYGVASHDYMNYVDDTAMFMFTTDQAAAMASQISPAGESYSLTLHPELLNWSARTSVATLDGGKSLDIFPNPATGRVSIVFDNTADALLSVSVLDVMGREVQGITNSNPRIDNYSIDLGGMTKGIYFIRCNFASGSITRKILLQ